MISEEEVLEHIAGLNACTLSIWVEQEWIKPEGRAGAFVYTEIDLARMRFLQTLEDDLDVGSEAIPIILSLIDQLHEMRGFVKALTLTLESQTPETREGIIELLKEQFPTSR